MTTLYRPADGRRVRLPGGSQDWPASGLPADLSNPYVARLVRDKDLVPVKGGVQINTPAVRNPAKKHAGDGA